MTPDDLKAWRSRMGMSQQAAAEALGVSLATIQSAETGRRPISVMMTLACRWIEYEASDDVTLMMGPPRGFDPAATPDPSPDNADLLTIQQSIDDIVARLSAVERTSRTAHQRAQEACLAIEEAGLPIHQQIIPMTEEEAEEAYLKIRKAQLLEQMNRAAKAAHISSGEPWDE